MAVCAVSKLKKKLSMELEIQLKLLTPEAPKKGGWDCNSDLHGNRIPPYGGHSSYGGGLVIQFDEELANEPTLAGYELA
ncbi:hypothetical protein JTE90_022281 [Oedothorax gibbosus]|uniref:Uncharacterized protein n=1 Tax=Oedothorax gibbosus TaxID=931172 RepID=A0AAV6VX39_9ARAC|nr:hypothetical protein JTE90_022281 [Oedothorax gibbosus]